MDESSSHKASWLERLSAFLMREPEDREELVDVLHAAFDRHLMDADALMMIEGVLQVSDLQVRDIMIPRAQMDVVDINGDPKELLPYVIEKAHSRFPVVDGDKDHVIGILLAKDLLKFFGGHETNLRDMLRPAVFIPESKRLNVLLKDFRQNRNHIAIVVDEYGGVGGLVTIEDVMEQIVGDIEDEYDYDEIEENIVAEDSNRFRVKATTEIDDFNEHFGTRISDDDHDTIGGVILTEFGHLPKRGESIRLGDLNVEVLRADSRRVHTLLVTPLSPSRNVQAS